MVLVVVAGAGLAGGRSWFDGQAFNGPGIGLDRGLQGLEGGGQGLQGGLEVSVVPHGAGAASDGR